MLNTKTSRVMIALLGAVEVDLFSDIITNSPAAAIAVRLAMSMIILSVVYIWLSADACRRGLARLRTVQEAPIVHVITRSMPPISFDIAIKRCPTDDEGTQYVSASASVTRTRSRIAYIVLENRTASGRIKAMLFCIALF